LVEEEGEVRSVGVGVGKGHQRSSAVRRLAAVGRRPQRFRRGPEPSQTQGGVAQRVPKVRRQLLLVRLGEIKGGRKRQKQGPFFFFVCLVVKVRKTSWRLGAQRLSTGKKK
jgi:hypothetical protein